MKFSGDSRTECCDTEAVSVLTLLLSLMTAGCDGACGYAATPDSPVKSSLLKASTSNAGRGDWPLRGPVPSTVSDAGAAVDLGRSPGNLAKDALKVSGMAFPLSSSATDPSMEFLCVLSISSSSTSSRSPSDDDAWKGSEEDACGVYRALFGHCGDAGI